MNMWPSMRDLTNLNIYPDYQVIHIALCYFGAFSRKPLSLSGTWCGLRVLMKLHELLRPLLKKRSLIKLTKQQGRFQILACLCVCEDMRH